MRWKRSLTGAFRLYVMEDKRYVWTSWIFIYRTDFSAHADDSESDLGEKIRKNGVDADGKYDFGNRAYRDPYAASQGESCVNVTG